MNKAIWIGYDPREKDAMAVCINSIKAHLSEAIPIHAIAMQPMMEAGLYTRPTRRVDGQLYDDISGAPMSTEFAITRFFIPHICRDDEIALFMDCDMLVRCDLTRLFELFDPMKAIQVVQHEYEAEQATKMDGQIQTSYGRKNWSSVMLWNLKHEAHQKLTLDRLNTMSGRHLHQFVWLNDEEIGALPKEWNHLVGVHPPNPDANIVHFTLGIPSMKGYENCEFADEWTAELEIAR